MKPSIRYSIIYVRTNIMSDEKISIGLVYVTQSGWSFNYSKEKVRISGELLSEEQGKYVESFISGFRDNYLEGRNSESVLSVLDTMHRYSNNYVVFSPVIELNVSEALMSHQRLYDELVQRECEK